jgi:hypothetical protein
MEYGGTAHNEVAEKKPNTLTRKAETKAEGSVRGEGGEDRPRITRAGPLRMRPLDHF